jgi:hypothetical protein
MLIEQEYKCYICQVIEIVIAPEEDFIKWQEGGYIQDIFPYLFAETREIMISGICGECYNKMFGEEE